MKRLMVRGAIWFLTVGLCALVWSANGWVAALDGKYGQAVTWFCGGFMLVFWERMYQTQAKRTEKMAQMLDRSYAREAETSDALKRCLQLKEPVPGAFAPQQIQGPVL